jgi:amidohydrolase
MDKKMLRAALKESIDRNRAEIIRIGEEIFKNPETGFKEFNTARIVTDSFKELGLKFSALEEYPGVKATIDTGREGPGIAIVAELDSVVCWDHPDCNKETGAVHACGHNAQIAAMLGAAISIVETGISKHLSGKLHFIAVPAEEYIEIAYRLKLREKGVIKYLGGKPELLRKGFFDDVDICVAIHLDKIENKKIVIEKSANGCIAKNIKYIGKPAHAGGSPHKGINALYASSLGLMAINSIRETFKESEYIRVHPIVTKGGDVVNVIPSDVHLETFVRGKTLEDILKASIKVDRALVGGAYAMGAKVEIEDLPGYFPTVYDDGLRKIAKEVGLDLVTEEELGDGHHGTASTDWGDISTIMPVLETYFKGFSGTQHGSDYRIVDPDTSYILSAKFLSLMAVELLCDRAEKAKLILKSFKPLFKSKEDYFKMVDKLFRKRILPEEDYRDKDMEELI